MNENFYDSFGCSPPQKLSEYIIKRNERSFYSEYKMQGLTIIKDFHCASFCLYILYSTKMLGKDFKSAVLNLYYQVIK